MTTNRVLFMYLHTFRCHSFKARHISMLQSDVIVPNGED